MRKSYFAQAFRLATEDGSSDATVLPVVLEIDVKATDGSDEATPAQDPALEESATDAAPAAEPAAENDDGTTPVDAPAADAIPAPTDSESVEEFENNLITTDDLEAAETNTEIEEQLQEEEAVTEAVSEVEEQMEVQEEVLNQNPESVNKEGVAIATECLYRAVKTAGLDPKMFQSLNKITVEKLSQEDFSLSPVQALSIVHEDMKSFVQGAKDGLRRLWEMIVNNLKKLWEFVKRIFGNHAAIAKKLKETLNNSNYDPTDKTFKITDFFLASTVLNTTQFELGFILETQEKTLKAVIAASNKFVERLNAGDQKLFGKNIITGELDMDTEIGRQLYTFFNGDMLKYENDFVIGIGATKIGVIGMKGTRTVKVTKDMIKEPVELNLPSNLVLNSFLDAIINKWSKTYLNSLTNMVKNAERVKPEKLASKMAQYIFKQVCFQMIKVYEVCLIDETKAVLRMVKHCIQAGTSSADKKDEETKK